ncbi:DUF3846 domain-containing protein [Streptomyces sp. KS 21]|uniref:DUF3846 domain-containing protein n=1 Tax=Streptomyces sp. KS 21 TaxID=2485150 RepID=UPI0010629F32|nr:DUF3846 domain-containing protein [Streptomyces sp. KS 21]TDU67829.1 hypothetical protein EDD91_7888 [Streptomyces sp. KS 21]
MPILTQDSYALRVEPTGKFSLLDWGTDTCPQDALCADQVRSVDLTTQLIMWTDELAVPLGRPDNAPARHLLHSYQGTPSPVCGTVVFTGSTCDGRLLGLTEDQALVLVDRYINRHRDVPRPRR